MDIKDKKIAELHTLLEVIQKLQPNNEHLTFLAGLGEELGYRIPTVVASLMQSKVIIEKSFSDVFHGFDVMSIDEVKRLYRDRDDEISFFSLFQIDEQYNTKPTFEFSLYENPLAYKDAVDDEKVSNVRHWLPLFQHQGEYIAINLDPDALGELLTISMDYSVTLIAPSAHELVADMIGGLEQNVYSIDEYGDVIAPSNWHLKQKVRDGVLEMDEYGDIIYDDASSPYIKAELTDRREFKTPLVAPIMSALVFFIYLGYLVIYSSGSEIGILESIKGIAFKIFLASQIGILVTQYYNARMLQYIYITSPVISNQAQIEALKPMIRVNMYSALLVMLLMGLSALAAIMTLLNDVWLHKLIVVALSIFTAYIIKRYEVIEERIKNLSVESPELEAEFNSIVQCWMHKPLPNF